MISQPFDIDRLDGATIKLPAIGTQRAAAHVFERESLLAVKAALDCGRPLLVRGRPGVGKTQLARAVARELGRVFLSVFIDARTEAHDLLWSHDAVTRLAEAQIWGHRGAGDAEAGKQAGKAPVLDAATALARHRYVVPGPLWWAFDWDGALRHLEHSAVPVAPPAIDDQVDPRQGAVLLVDEIDKADSSVPNGLLECLGQGSFSVPGIDGTVCIQGPPPLVLLTTNDDRVLPDAFIRRCLVLWLRVPEAEPAFEERGLDDPLIRWLVERGRAHFGEELPEQVYVDAAVQLARDRTDGAAYQRYVPGLAEYIDLLSALRADPQRKLDELSRFFLRKHIDPGPTR
ncbi:MAG: MoxR family ATPase [Myxococcota bacterium]